MGKRKLPTTHVVRAEEELAALDEFSKVDMRLDAPQDFIVLVSDEIRSNMIRQFMCLDANSSAVREGHLSWIFLENCPFLALFCVVALGQHRTWNVGRTRNRTLERFLCDSRLSIRSWSVVR